MKNRLDEIFLQWESFTNLERDRQGQKREYRLDRMEKLCTLFANPQEHFKSIHIAGSKGKGSTAIMGARILQEAGYRVGLYSSPHMMDYRERFALFPEPESHEEVLLQQALRIQDVLDSEEPKSLPGGSIPTTFEVLTLLSFLFFQAMDCQWVMVETGLGGRLDATNVLLPQASIITPIELEHQDFLGDSLEKIATEKAGIIKQGRRVFVAPQTLEVLQVIKKVCEEKKSEWFYLPDFLKEAQYVHRDGKFLTELNWKDMDYPRQFNLTMLGGVQGYNAALIILCIKSLLPNISQEKITRGIQSANLPGRGEWIKGSPDILMDGAHTAKSLKNLMDLLQYFPQEPKILLFGCAADKDSAAMAKEIAGHFNQVIITTPGSFKRSDPPRVFKIFKEQKIPCMAIYNEKAAYKKARELAGDRGILLITGSFFLISEIKSLG